jgi:hypothetical protein
LLSEGGFLTVDFMLAMIVTLGCMMLLLRISISLVSVQVAQYVAYAAARAHSAGDLTKQDQIDAGELKYKSLLKDRGLMAGFFKPGVNIQPSGIIGEFNSIYSAPSGDDGTDDNGTPFVGARTEIKLPRLGFSMPFLGRTSDEDEDFKSYVNAMIFREPSNEECRQFFQPNRYETILRLDGRFNDASGFAADYVPLEDSGC